MLQVSFTREGRTGFVQVATEAQESRSMCPCSQADSGAGQPIEETRGGC